MNLVIKSVIFAGIFAANVVWATEEIVDIAKFPDFAAFEFEGKCPAIVQQATSVAAIQQWDQEKLDLLYACSFAGPIPSGFMDGTVILAAGGNYAQFGQVLGEFNIPSGEVAVKKFAEAVWDGKIFDPEAHMLLNQIGPTIPVGLIPPAEQLPTLLKPLAAYSGAKIPNIIYGGLKKALQRFPARVFCGSSILDGRRDSIVIDYYNSEKLKGYVSIIDKIADKHGLKIRDEVRQVKIDGKPGFYLGRAYLDRVFFLNFTLEGPAPTSKDTCWKGEQAVAAVPPQ